MRRRRRRRRAGGDPLRLGPWARRRWARVALAGLLAGCAGSSADPDATETGSRLTSQSDPRAARARDAWMGDVDALATALGRLDSAAQRLDGSTLSTRGARRRFLEARQAFKRLEFVASYYEPSTTRLMNGPALPRVEHEEGPEAVFPPEGFQVVEELLFGDPDASQSARVVSETRNLMELTTRLRRVAASQVVTDDRLWDAAKLQVARLVSIGITGADSPVATLSLTEGAAALRGVRGALAVYEPDLSRDGSDEWAVLDSAFADAITALERGHFATFDRLGFIVGHANPLAHALDAARRRLGIEPPREQRAFAMNAVTLFDRGAFDAQAFAPPSAQRDTPARAALGRRLFFEPRLSGDGTRSCASCHEPARAFTDGRVRSAALAGGATLRNSPTIINAGLQAGAFYDLRTTYLEDQVADVVGNRDEMHGSVERAAVSVARDQSYHHAFAAAFGKPSPGTRGDSVVTAARLRSAIAAYVRGLNGLESPVDRALRGNILALDAAERRGLNLFMGRAKCATCHFAPLFNGTVPPMYQESEVEVLGVPSRNVTTGARVDPDSGRFRVTRAAPHLHAFKTPTVRNVALTAPYMHNGVFGTLEEVVDFYDRGGGAGIGVTLENQTLPPERLRLTAEEKHALVAFMRALTDTTGTTAR